MHVSRPATVTTAINAISSTLLRKRALPPPHPQRRLNRIEKPALRHHRSSSNPIRHNTHQRSAPSMPLVYVLQYLLQRPHHPVLVLSYPLLPAHESSHLRNLNHTTLVLTGASPPWHPPPHRRRAVQQPHPYSHRPL